MKIIMIVLVVWISYQMGRYCEAMDHKAYIQDITGNNP